MSKLYLIITTFCGLVLLSACGGEGPSNCYDYPWLSECRNSPVAASQREHLCRLTPTTHASCGQDIGNYCLQSNPHDPICTPEERFMGCLNNPIKNCLGAGGVVTSHCERNFFDPSTACQDTQFNGLRVAACSADINADPSCRAVLNVGAQALALPAPSHTAAASVMEKRVNDIDVYTRASGAVRIPNGRTLSALGLDAVRTTSPTNERLPVVETLRRGDDPNDGLTVFAGSADNNPRHNFAIAGILASTDVGAPLPNTAGKTASWFGQYILHSNIRAKSLTHNGAEDISFNINFEDREITTADDVATSRNAATFKLVDTTFDERGVISGSFEVDSTDTSSYSDLLASSGNWTSEVLGLIGSRGLVGLLHGTLADNPDDTTVDPDAEVFAGGFVADRDRVVFDVWRDDPQVSGAPATSNPRNEFVRVVTPNASSGLSLSFDASDAAVGGVASYITTAGHRYAGLHGGANGTAMTDVGARIDQYSNVNGIWRGSLALARGQNGSALRRLTRGQAADGLADMRLIVEFGTGSQNGGGRIAAFVKVEDAADDQTARYLDNTHLLLNGEFNSDGVLTGTTLLDDFPQRGFNTDLRDGGESFFGTGVLSGLIGEDGAVAAIISDGSGSAAASYAGGFVAVPTGRTAGGINADYAVWESVARPADAPNSGGTATSRFLKNTNGALSTDGVTGATITTLTLADNDDSGQSLGGQSDDGVAFFVGNRSGTTPAYFGSVLDSTSLGAPLPDYAANTINLPATAKWPGRFQTLGRSGTGFNHNLTLETDFTLEVDYQRKRIEALIPVQGDFVFHIQGRYDSSGVILPLKTSLGISPTTHSAIYADLDENRTYQSGNRAGGAGRSDISGLIGQEGAVGVFRSWNSGSGFAGGFVARPGER